MSSSSLTAQQPLYRRQPLLALTQLWVSGGRGHGCRCGWRKWGWRSGVSLSVWMEESLVGRTPSNRLCAAAVRQPPPPPPLCSSLTRPSTRFARVAMSGCSKLLCSYTEAGSGRQRPKNAKGHGKKYQDCIQSVPYNHLKLPNKRNVQTCRSPGTLTKDKN